MLQISGANFFALIIIFKVAVAIGQTEAALKEIADVLRGVLFILIYKEPNGAVDPDMLALCEPLREPILVLDVIYFLQIAFNRLHAQGFESSGIDIAVVKITDLPGFCSLRGLGCGGFISDLL